VVDPLARRARLRLGESKLGWCDGRLCTPDGPLAASWSKEGRAIRWRASLPAGWTLEVEGAPGVELIADGAREEARRA
jgi:alpha-L-rhamnosidase